jgi:hypothetical protein
MQRVECEVVSSRVVGPTGAAPRRQLPHVWALARPDEQCVTRDGSYLPPGGVSTPLVGGVIGVARTHQPCYMAYVLVLTCSLVLCATLLLSWACGSMVRSDEWMLLRQCGLPPLDLMDGGSSPLRELHSGRVAARAVADIRGCHKVGAPCVGLRVKCRGG